MRAALPKAVLAALSVTGYPEANGMDWTEFGGSEWQRTLAWMDLSGLALYFRHAAATLKFQDSLPRFVREQLEQRYTENTRRVAAMSDEFRAVNELFETVHVPYAVLKGFSMEPDYCASASDRAQYDYDYLVHRDHLYRAEQVLQTAGYRRKESRERRHIVYLPPACGNDNGNTKSTVGLYSADLARPIELHVSLWNAEEEKIAFEVPENIFDRVLSHEWRSQRFAALSDEDALIFQALHTFRHILHNWCRLASFLELACFLKNRFHDANFWRRFCARIDGRRGLGEAAGVVFTLAARVFDAAVPVAAHAHTISILPSAVNLWIERYGKQSALENFRGDKFSLLLYRQFIDDPASWVEARRRRLFPFRLPHRLPQPLAGPNGSSSGKSWPNTLNALSRIKFHLGSALRYAWELPRWRSMVREASIEKPEVPEPAECVLANPADSSGKRH